jgi:hypothetical protein
MTAHVTSRERVFRAALGLFLGFCAYNVGLTGGGTEPTVLAWGCAILAVVAIATAIAGAAGPLARVGLDADWSVGFLAARLYVGWEFLYAGWEKMTQSWYTQHAGTLEVKRILQGAIAQSQASAQNPFPAVPHRGVCRVLRPLPGAQGAAFRHEPVVLRAALEPRWRSAPPPELARALRGLRSAPRVW